MLYSGSLHIGTCPCKECNDGIEECSDCKEPFDPDTQVTDNGGVCDNCVYGRCPVCDDLLNGAKKDLGEGDSVEYFCLGCAEDQIEWIENEAIL